MSPSTVSQALADKGMLRAETRERVRAAARRAGYFVPSDPFGVDPALSGRPLRVVILRGEKLSISNHTPTSFSLIALQGIQTAAAPYHLSLVLTTPADVLKGEPPDLVGTLIAGGYLPAEAQLALERCARPVVMIGSHVSSNYICSIEPDAVAGIRLAMQHLVALGHRRIAFLNGPPDTATSDMKLTGFVRAAHDAGFSPTFLAQNLAPFSFPAACAQAEQLLRADWRNVTAVICAYEYLAMGVMHAARQVGLQVPQDISVIGYHDEGVGALCNPPLTTLGWATERLGRLAVNLVLSVRHNRDLIGTRMMLLPELVVRSSTAPAPDRPADTHNLESDTEGK